MLFVVGRVEPDVVSATDALVDNEVALEPIEANEVRDSAEEHLEWVASEIGVADSNVGWVVS